MHRLHQYLKAIISLLLIGALVITMTLPGEQIRHLRLAWADFNSVMSWFEMIQMSYGLNAIHITAYFACGLGCRLLGGRKAALLGFLGLFVVALGFEIIQLWIPGRHFRLSDVVTNWMSLAIGFATGSLVINVRDLLIGRYLPLR